MCSLTEMNLECVSTNTHLIQLTRYQPCCAGSALNTVSLSMSLTVRYQLHSFSHGGPPTHKNYSNEFFLLSYADLKFGEKVALVAQLC